MDIGLNTRLIDLTLGDLLEFLDNRDKENQSSNNPDKALERKVVHGMSGIAKVIGKSHTTVWRMKKDGVFDGYISQVGNSIVAYEDDIIRAGKAHFEKTQKNSGGKKPRRIK